jgi:hypothetical protein
MPCFIANKMKNSKELQPHTNFVIILVVVSGRRRAVCSGLILGVIAIRFFIIFLEHPKVLQRCLVVISINNNSRRSRPSSCRVRGEKWIARSNVMQRRSRLCRYSVFRIEGVQKAGLDESYRLTAREARLIGNRRGTACTPGGRECTVGPDQRNRYPLLSRFRRYRCTYVSE